MKGFTLVEILVASAVLAIGLASLYGGVFSTRSVQLRNDMVVTGRLLARSVMDQAVHRFRNRDARFFRLQTPPREILSAAIRGEWQKPFLALAQPRTRVITPAGFANPYFDSSSGPLLPMDLVPQEEQQFWRCFTYEVRVNFTISVRSGTPAVPIDSDGDGKGETDMAQLEVEVFNEPPDRPQGVRSVSILRTLLTSPDKQPGAASYATF